MVRKKKTVKRKASRYKMKGLGYTYSGYGWFEWTHRKTGWKDRHQIFRVYVPPEKGFRTNARAKEHIKNVIGRKYHFPRKDVLVR